MRPLLKLPDSQQEAASLTMVAVIAAFAALARVLYGKEEMRWRYTVGALFVAMATSIMVYGAVTYYFGVIGGHASAAIGAATGLFTDDVLKRAKEWMEKKTRMESGEEQEKVKPPRRRRTD